MMIVKQATVSVKFLLSYRFIHVYDVCVSNCVWRKYNKEPIQTKMVVKCIS